MNFNCAICVEQFRNQDAQNIRVTQCGHVFHNECLVKWLKNSKTCPECRSETTSSNLIRMFVNILDNDEAAMKLVDLESEIYGLKLQIAQKDDAIRIKDLAIISLTEANERLRHEEKHYHKVTTFLQNRFQEMYDLAKGYEEQVSMVDIFILHWYNT